MLAHGTIESSSVKGFRFLAMELTPKHHMANTAITPKLYSPSPSEARKHPSTWRPLGLYDFLIIGLPARA